MDSVGKAQQQGERIASLEAMFRIMQQQHQKMDERGDRIEAALLDIKTEIARGKGYWAGIGGLSLVSGAVGGLLHKLVTPGQ